MTTNHNKRRFHYLAFGLHILSEIELPELLVNTDDHTFDVQIAVSTSRQYHKETRENSQGWDITPDRFVLLADKIGRFTVRNGKRIIVEIQQGVDLDIVRTYLLGTCFGVLFHQRGLLPLHSSSVAVEGGAVLFSGPVGTGKSTLAGAYHNAGYKVLADDVSVLSISDKERPLVYPAYPQLKISNASAEALRINTSQLRHISSSDDRYRLPIHSRFQHSPLPLAAIFILEKHKRNSFSYEILTGYDKFIQLMMNTYRYFMVKNLGCFTSHFSNCSALLNKTPLIRVFQPQNTTEPGETVHFLQRNSHILYGAHRPTT